MTEVSQDGWANLPTVDHAGAVFGEAGPAGIGGLGGSLDGPLEEVHVFWLAGMSCDGCSVAVTGATNPSVEDLLAGSIPGLPRAVLHHPVLSVSAGTVTFNLISSTNPSTIAANIALQFPESSGIDVNTLIASGLALFVVTLAVNVLARAVVNRRADFSGAN